MYFSPSWKKFSSHKTNYMWKTFKCIHHQWADVEAIKIQTSSYGKIDWWDTKGIKYSVAQQWCPGAYFLETPNGESLGSIWYGLNNWQIQPKNLKNILYFFISTIQSWIYQLFSLFYQSLPTGGLRGVSGGSPGVRTIFARTSLLSHAVEQQFRGNPRVGCKVWTFWEAHKIWKNLPHGLDVY